MVCPICNTLIEDESAIKCPGCNEYLDVAQQRQRVNQAVSRTGGILSEIFKSKRFRAFCILFSIVCGFYAVACLLSISYYGLFSSIITYGLYIGFGIVSLVAAWNLYTQSTKKSGKELLGKFNNFYKLMQIMMAISFFGLIVLCIIMFLYLIVLIGNTNAIAEAIPELKQTILTMQQSGEIVFTEDFTMDQLFAIMDFVAQNAILVFVLTTALMVGGCVYSFYNMKAYKSITLFVGNLESTAVTYAYIPSGKYSKKLLVVMGIINIVMATPTLSISIVSGAVSILYGVIMIVLANIFDEFNTKLSENSGRIYEQRSILDNMIASHKAQETGESTAQ